MKVIYVVIGDMKVAIITAITAPTFNHLPAASGVVVIGIAKVIAALGVL